MYPAVRWSIGVPAPGPSWRGGTVDVPADLAELPVRGRSREENPISGKGKTPRRYGRLGKHRGVLEARRLVIQKHCVELRVMGLSQSAIAEQLFKDKLTPRKFDGAYVSRMLAAALDQVVVPGAEKLKKLELQRLDDMINGHYGNAVNGDVGATHAVLACVDRRMRLLGIGQETKVSTQQLGADGKPVDPIRPVIDLTITRSTPDAHGVNGRVIDAPPQLLAKSEPQS